MRSELAERNVEVLAPVPEGAVVEDRVGKREFTIDLAAGIVRCPAGQTAAIRTSKQGSRGANFSRAACGELPAQGPLLPRPARTGTSTSQNTKSC